VDSLTVTYQLVRPSVTYSSLLLEILRNAYYAAVAGSASELELHLRELIAHLPAELQKRSEEILEKKLSETSEEENVDTNGILDEIVEAPENIRLEKLYEAKKEIVKIMIQHGLLGYTRFLEQGFYEEQSSL